MPWGILPVPFYRDPQNWCTVGHHPVTTHHQLDGTPTNRTLEKPLFYSLSILNLLQKRAVRIVISG